MNNILGIFLIFSTFTLGFSGVLTAKESEGQERVFILNKADPYAPLKIKSLEKKRKGEEYLRDPALNPHKHFSSKKQKKIIVIREKAANYTPKRLKFKRAKIRGRASKPRVAFTRPRLRLKRSDERPRLDFYRKAFDQEPGKL